MVRAWLTGYCINLVRVRYSKLLWIEVETGVVLIRLVGWPAVPLRTSTTRISTVGNAPKRFIYFFISSFSLGKSLVLQLMILATAFVLL